MDEKLTLRTAVQLLGIDCDIHKKTTNIPCPICSKSPRDKKLNLNFDRYHPDDGAFRCNKCGISGRALHFWALYRGLDIYNPKEAASDYYKYRNEKYPAGKNLPKAKPYVPVEVEIADVDTRDRTYRALLSMLTLSPTHRKDLLSRGLMEDDIIINGYKSYPVAGIKEICKFLMSNGYILEGVPGFYVDKHGDWTMRTFSTAGYIIPQLDGFGRIQGLQIRLEKGKPKYMTLSTDGFNKGAKGRTFCHLAKGNNLEDVILTEGPLKADIIRKFTGYSVIAIPGVNSISYLKKAIIDLKKKGMKKITIAFDMDMYTNEHVKEALEKLKNMLVSLDCPFTVLYWDESQKGLDDWLYATKVKK